MVKVVTINDLKLMEKDKKELSPQQRLALKNFERFRSSKLSGIKNENKFQIEFQRFQSLANLTAYQEYLKDEYL